MQIVLVNGGIFFVNDFSCVQNDAAVNGAVIDELIERLLWFVLVVQFQSTDLGSTLFRQINDCARAPHDGCWKYLGHMSVNPMRKRSTLVPIFDSDLSA